MVVELSLDTIQKKTEECMKVWTCDVCHVVQLPTFEEAVEHEKMCTGLPPPPSTMPQTKAAAHLEHEKSEKEIRSSVTTTSEQPTNQSLGGVNLYDTHPLPQPQQLSITALDSPVGAANKVAQDIKGDDFNEQEPVKEVPVAAMTSKPRQVTVTDDTNRVRAIYSGDRAGVRGVPLGVEAATIAASSGCPERSKEPNPFYL